MPGVHWLFGLRPLIVSCFWGGVPARGGLHSQIEASINVELAYLRQWL